MLLSKTPVIAEVSFLRWSFEALAVEEVKNNNYERYFYQLDKDLETSNFYAKKMIPLLQNKLDNFQQNSGQSKLVLAIQSELKHLGGCPF